MNPFASAAPASGPAPVMSAGIGLRASTAADSIFLASVFSSTRVDEFVAAGLPAETIAALMAQQFELQNTYYRRHYVRAHFDIVTQAGAELGRLYHDWSPRELRIIDIALLPQYRGRGIGTTIMRDLLAEADRHGLAVSLYVEQKNPVRALYRRLGFVKAGENGIYELMRREALVAADAVHAPAPQLGGSTPGSHAGGAIGHPAP
jgi:ribosomal protein S18 acetylase RimI-like enzyme